MAQHALYHVGDGDHRDDTLSDGDWLATTDEELDGDVPCERKRNRVRRERAQAQRRAQRRDAPADRGPRERPAVRRQRPGSSEAFRCRHCRTLVGPVPSGGRHRNHCPICLHSRHVDARMPGDRMSTCGGTMAPIGAYVRPGGEHGLVHRCHDCGVVRHNRIAADDDISLVLRLPDMTERALARGESGTISAIQKTTASA